MGFFSRIIRFFSGKPDPLPTMNKKLAHEFAMKKLEEVVCEGRDKIMSYFDEYGHGFITKEGKEYVYEVAEDGGFILMDKEEGVPIPEESLGDFLYQYKIEAAYTGDKETKEFIEIIIDVDDGLLAAKRPICRSICVHASDLSIYESSYDSL